MTTGQQPMSTEQDKVNPAQLAKQLAKEQRKAKAAVEQAEKQREKEAKKQRNLEIARKAQEAKAQKKQDAVARLALFEQEMVQKREQSRIKKEENMENMRQQQEAKRVKEAERKAKHEAHQKVEAENARLRAETTVIVTLDQQALLDQIRLVAEQTGKGSKLAKINLVSVGNTSQVTLTFETADQAAAFLKSKPENNDLLVKMDAARPLAGPRRSCFFPIDLEAHTDRTTAQTAVIASVKRAKINFVYAGLRGTSFVMEFASDADATKACATLNKGTCYLGTAKSKTILGKDAAVGNPPRRINKKRTHSDM